MAPSLPHHSWQVQSARLVYSRHVGNVKCSSPASSASMMRDNTGQVLPVRTWGNRQLRGWYCQTARSTTGGNSGGSNDRDRSSDRCYGDGSNVERSDGKGGRIDDQKDDGRGILEAQLPTVPPAVEIAAGGGPISVPVPDGSYPSDVGSSSGRGRVLQFRTAADRGHCGKTGSSSRGGLTTLKSQLAALGVAGVVAYGILNTLYYTFAFYLIWHYVAKVPRGLGVSGTVAKCAEVAALTWVGSQATKVLRIAGAVVFSPLVASGLVVLQGAVGLRSRRSAASVVIAACLFLALAFYGSIVLLWA